MYHITGMGAYVPENIVTNDDLSKLVETSDEWITQRVGIKERRISIHDTTHSMGLLASEEALKEANWEASDLDLILVATVSSEDSTPSTAAKIQEGLGATCPAFDISAACSGFLFLLETARAFISLGYKKILCVSSERMSRLMDFSDRNTCVIFGDGACALTLEPGEDHLYTKLMTKGGDAVIKVPNFKGNSPFYQGENPSPFIYMNGQETFKFAVKQMVKDVREALDKTGLTSDDIQWIVPHQANIRIIDTAKKKLPFEPEKYVVNIHRYGNTSAASVPLALYELRQSGKMKPGDHVLLTAFGGGLTSGVTILRFS